MGPPVCPGVFFLGLFWVGFVFRALVRGAWFSLLCGGSEILALLAIRGGCFFDWFVPEFLLRPVTFFGGGGLSFFDIFFWLCDIFYCVGTVFQRGEC